MSRNGFHHAQTTNQWLTQPHSHQSECMKAAAPLKDTSWNNMENKDILLSSSSCWFDCFTLNWPSQSPTFTVLVSGCWRPLMDSLDWSRGLSLKRDDTLQPFACLLWCPLKGLDMTLQWNPDVVDMIQFPKPNDGLEGCGGLRGYGWMQTTGLGPSFTCIFLFAFTLRRLCISQEGQEKKMIWNMWD